MSIAGFRAATRHEDIREASLEVEFLRMTLRGLALPITPTMRTLSEREMRVNGRADPTFATLLAEFEWFPYRIVPTLCGNAKLHADTRMFLPNLLRHFDRTPVREAWVEAVKESDKDEELPPVAIVFRRKGLPGGLILRPGEPSGVSASLSFTDAKRGIRLYMEPYMDWLRTVAVPRSD